MIRIKEPEKILARVLLCEIYIWQREYKNKLIKKYPDRSMEKIDDMVLNYSAKKFREPFNKVLKIKMMSLINQPKKEKE